MHKLLEPINVKTPGDNVFIWGCLHLGHDPKWDEPLWQKRGFASVEEMDRSAFGNWAKCLNDESVLFLLGDNIFGQKATERLTEVLARMPYKECYLMPGNHVAGWRQLMKSAGDLVLYFGEDNAKPVYFCPNYLEAFIDQQSVVMSHYPILSWNGMGNGSYHFYSHVHNSLKDSELGRMYIERARSLEVSVEHFKAPPSFTQLRNILADRPATTFDHHGPQTQNPF